MIHLSETDMPVDWTCDSIQNSCLKVTSGGTPSRKNKDFYINGVIPWVKTKELEDGYIHQTEESITHDAINKSSAKLLPSGTILLAMYGATVGMLGITQGDMACNQACCALITDSEALDKDFLFYFLLCNRKNLINLATGAAQQNISGALIKQIAVPRPDLIEQRKIGTVLRTLGDKIELNQKMNQTLEEIAKAIFKSWFVDFDPVRAKAEGRPTGLPPEISDLFPDELVDSEIGEIPKGWQELALNEVFTPRNERAGDREIREFSSTNDGIQPRDAKYKKNLSSSSSKNKVAHKGDFVFGMSREVLNFGLMSNEVGGFSSAYKIYEVSGDYDFSDFVYRQFLSRPQYYYQAVSASSREGQSISQDTLLNLKIFSPNPSVFSIFNSTIAPLRERCELLLEENHLLSELRDTLLPKLISGELRIPDAEKFLEEAGI